MAIERLTRSNCQTSLKYDDINDLEDEDWEFRDYVSLRLQGGLWGKNFKRDRDAVIVAYCWD